MVCWSMMVQNGAEKVVRKDEASLCSLKMELAGRV